MESGGEEAEAAVEAPALTAAPAAPAAPVVKGDLAARLKSRGLQLPTEVPSLSSSSLNLSLSGGFSSIGGAGSRGGRTRGGGSTAAAVQAVPAASCADHRPLEFSAAEKKELFTPLVQRGTDAIEEERRRKAKGEQDRLKEVKATLKRWVQECLAREDKRKKFLEKGMLKCRVQAKWSEGLHEQLKELIAGYKGRLMADGEKENNGSTAGNLASKHPAWLPRNERWLVGFDAAAFEAYMAAHPEVVDPPEAKLRLFVEEFFATEARVESTRLKQLVEALESQFGPLRAQLLKRAEALAEEFVSARTKKGTKRKEATAEKELLSGAKRSRIEAARIGTLQDAAWAASTLAPLGLHGEAGTVPLVRVPAAVALPILEGLRALESIPAFHDALRSTPVGKVVNGYRHHSNNEVAGVAKDLVAAWKAACRAPTSK